MVVQTSPYALAVELHVPHAEAVQRTRAALAAAGFGVLCEIDIAATLAAKLGVAFPPYVTLGACNPPLAHRALQAEPDIGLLLPCNVIVRQQAEGMCTVAAMDPVQALALTGNTAIEPLAQDVRARLVGALDALAAAGAP